MNGIPAAQPTAAQILQILPSATSLSLNTKLILSELDGVPAPDLQLAGIQLAAGTFTNPADAHWFKIVHNKPVGVKFEFRSYFRRPSLNVQETVVIDVFGVNSIGQLIKGNGFSIHGEPGSSVAHGKMGMSKRRFTVSVQGFPIYYFRVALLEGSSPPANPYVFLVTEA